MRVQANGIAIEVDQQGSPQGEPLVLIMGLGMQLVGWQDGFVRGLVAQGFHVIRFDNRDAGLSQGFDQLGVPNLLWASLRHAARLPIRSAYSLSDMAHDTAGLLDALGIARAHVCGASMGGMIAQRLAVLHPQRVKSLSLVMTTSGSRRLPGPTRPVRAALMSHPADPTSLASVVAHQASFCRLIGSPGYPADEAWLSEWLSTSVQRAYRPEGTVRQLVAVAADGDRSPLLAQIRVPTQILHGSADPLVPLPAAHDLAARIAGAKLDAIEGMGHDLPEALWPRFTAGIRAAASRA